MISASHVFFLAGIISVSKYADAFSVNCQSTVRSSTKTNQISSYSLSAVAGLDTEEEIEYDVFPTQKEDQELSQSSPAKYDWSFVDKVYLITCPNADPGSVRLNKARDILDQVGLQNQVEIKAFDTDDEDRIRGCYTSHISVLKEGLREIQNGQSGTVGGSDWLGSFLSMFGDESSTKGLETHNDESNDGKTKPKCIMVLEDNLEVTGCLNSETLETVSDYLYNNENADMIHLSYIPYVPNLIVSKTENKNIVGLSTGQSSALGTTAYVITEKAMQTIIEEDAKNGFRAPIPDVMAEQFPESRFSAYPVPFLRAPKTKSLVNPQLDDLRELLFQPPVVVQFQNILAVTGLSTNTVFFATVAALVGAVGVSGMGVVDAVQQFLAKGSYDGNLVLLVINAMFSSLSLAIIAQGAALAPKPPPEAPELESDTEPFA